jgi:hypothetical protein
VGYSFPQELWKKLTDRIEQIQKGVPSLFSARPEVEAEAQRLIMEIRRKEAPFDATDQSKTSLNGYFAEDVETKHLRAVGVEYVALHATEQLKLTQIFTSLGYGIEQIKLFLALIIGRKANPGSEVSTFNWLQKTSALGDLIDSDFSSKSVMALHRACDELYDKRDEIDDLIYSNLLKTSNYDTTIAFYDLTNTYFDVNPDDEDAKRGF